MTTATKNVMREKRTSQLIAELKRMAKEGYANIYKRVKLAHDIMEDTDWIVQFHEGSDTKAMDALQRDGFADVGGLISLGTMLAIYRKWPDEATWKEYQYDLAAMEITWHESEKESTGTTPQRRKWKEVATELQEEVKDLRVAKSNADKIVAVQNIELDQLRSRIRDLETENAILRGRIEELEKRHG